MPSPFNSSPNGTPFNQTTPFMDGIDYQPTMLSALELNGLTQGLVTTGLGMTVTNNGSATSVALGVLGNRPAGKWTSAASATSGLNVQVPAASILPQPGKRIWIRHSVYFVSSLGTTYAFGASTLNTNLANANSADQVILKKATTASVWTLSLVNNTGTAESVLVPNFVIAYNQWNDMAIELIDTGSGIGKVNVYGAANAAPDQNLPLLLAYTSITQFPDRSAGPIAPVFSGISGDGSANAMGVSRFDVRVEA